MNPSDQQQAAINMPSLRPIGEQDIQFGRQRLGAQVQNWSDEQIRDFLHRRQQEHLQKVQGRPLADYLAEQPRDDHGLYVTEPPTAPQVKPDSQPSQPSAQQGQQNTTTNSQAAASEERNKAPSAKQSSQSKLPSEEPTDAESMLMQNSSQPAVSQPGPPPVQSRPLMPIIREQLEGGSGASESGHGPSMPTVFQESIPAQRSITFVNPNFNSSLPQISQTPSDDLTQRSQTNENLPSQVSSRCQWAGCVYSFNRESLDSLLPHIEVDHILTSEQIYMCPVEECSENWGHKADLMSHLQLQHQNHPKGMKEYQDLKENVTQSPRVLHCKWKDCVLSADLYSSDELAHHIHIAHIESPRRLCRVDSVNQPPHAIPELRSHYNTRFDSALDTDPKLMTDNDVQDVKAEEESDLIKCICEFSHDDGNTICCEKCNKWQHVICYYDDDLQYPETHVCGECQARPLDVQRAKSIQEHPLERAARERREDDVRKTKRRLRDETGDIREKSRKRWAESSPLPRRVEPKVVPDSFSNESAPIGKRRLHPPSTPLPRSTTSSQESLPSKEVSLQEYREWQIKEQSGQSEKAKQQADAGSTGEIPAEPNVLEGSSG
ncbi:hypothetical protein BO78DRAFT_437617 [Aspergillus sclerotiicarbonarius CBS 121057]|uniref:C2H2-type domain-containing protein n=1 Tax=Aspergillus sclerotiicarbonarius (strain CBS 121057 / IBT 28362) TaxID=1448318 RepID=A0A319DST2_ASPSB|nr:hypothetical protein BO78DRAFT_437617 [Aspergillus sclerotiicarbonarius CBS 121057]